MQNKRISRRQFLKKGASGIAASMLPSLWLSGCNKISSNTRPNVVIIVLDTARSDRFGFAGYSRNTSPNIDKIAAEAAVFENTYSTCCWTLPSHASLFTGLHPHQAGATSETLQLPAFNKTIAQALSDINYKTAAFSCNSWVCKERGFANGFDEYFEIWKDTENLSENSTLETVAVEKFLDWLNKPQKTSKPFFAFLNLNGIHLPYQPPEPFLSRFINKTYSNEQVNQAANITAMWPYLAGKIKLTKTDFEIMSDLYDGEVAFADHCVEKIIDALRQAAVFDNTIFIITSDHGENLGEHNQIDHTLSMNETTLRIPLLIRCPGRFQPSRSKNLVSITDIAPTVLDLCRAGDINNINSQRSSLANKNLSPRPYIIAANERPLTGIALLKDRYPDFDTKQIDHRVRVIRNAQHKLIWNIDKDKRLYNILADPGELNNLADSDTETRNQMMRNLLKWLNDNPSAKDVLFMHGQDPQNLKMLRSLGYIK